MIRTVDDYRAGLRDGHEIWIDGEGVTNVTSNLRDTNAALFEEGGWRVQLDKFYLLNDNRPAEDRRKLLAFARDLLNSDYAGRLTSRGGIKIAGAPDASNCGVLFPRALKTPASAQKRILI